MDKMKVDLFIMSNGKYFESHYLSQIRDRLSEMDDSEWRNIQLLQFKDPTISLIVSLIGGYLGVDRFLIGDVGLGVAKLLTCGGLGIWFIVDWFLIMGATRDKNLEKLSQAF